MALMHRLQARRLGLRSIGRELARCGIGNPAGGSWHPHVIARSLRKPLHSR